MNWVEKLKRARKVFSSVVAEMEAAEEPDPEDIEAVRAIIEMTEVIEEVARHAKVPLTDWDKQD